MASGSPRKTSHEADLVEGPAAGAPAPGGDGVPTRQRLGDRSGHLISIFVTELSFATLSVMPCRPLVRSATEDLPSRKRVPQHELVLVHAVVVHELPGEDVLPGVAEHLRLRHQRGGAEAVGRHGVLDHGRRQLGLGEVGRRLLGQHDPEQLLAAGHVLALARDDERLTRRAVQRRRTAASSTASTVGSGAPVISKPSAWSGPSSRSRSRNPTGRAGRPGRCSTGTGPR